MICEGALQTNAICEMQGPEIWVTPLAALKCLLLALEVQVGVSRTSGPHVGLLY